MGKTHVLLHRERHESTTSRVDMPPCAANGPKEINSLIEAECEGKPNQNCDSGHQQTGRTHAQENYTDQ
jgi:hypothetical protein